MSEAPAPKRIRSSSPDVVVAVGTGDEMEEFECYRIALSFASPYFDALLSSNMRENNQSRIEFPDKSPEEWKVFYRFIDPSRMSESSHDAVVNEENVMMLTPWFHGFQMERFIETCDKVLSRKVVRLTQKRGNWRSNKAIGSAYSNIFWDKKSDDSETRLEERREAFKGVIELLQFACVYDFKMTKGAAEHFIGFVTHRDLSIDTLDVFDRSSIRILVDLSLPLEEVEEQEGEGEDMATWKHIVSRGKSDALLDFLLRWDFDDSHLGDDGLSLEDINNSSAMFVFVVESFIKQCALETELGNYDNAANGIIEAMHHLPDEIYDNMPNRSDRRTDARDYLKGAMRGQFGRMRGLFRQIGIHDLPESLALDSDE